MCFDPSVHAITLDVVIRMQRKNKRWKAKENDFCSAPSKICSRPAAMPILPLR